MQMGRDDWAMAVRWLESRRKSRHSKEAELGTRLGDELAVWG